MSRDDKVVEPLAKSFFVAKDSLFTSNSIFSISIFIARIGLVYLVNNLGKKTTGVTKVASKTCD